MVVVVGAIVATLPLWRAVPRAQTRAGSPTRERYVFAALDPIGNVVARTADGTTRVIPKGDDIQSFSEVRIAKDGTAVGATAWTYECCQSYPIPTRVMVLRAGQVRPFDVGGLSVEAWHFVPGAAQIAMSGTQHHVFCAHTFVLHLATGTIVAEGSEELQCQYIETPRQVPQPKWIRDLSADREAWRH